MHNKTLLGGLAFLLLIGACRFGQAAATPTSLPPTTTKTNAPTATTPPTAAPTATKAPKVIYDFLELACQAHWTNNGQDLLCPGAQYDNIGSGYVGVIEDPVLEGNLRLGEAVLLTHPAANGRFYGIFGAYPPIQIEAGDQFVAGLACLEGIEASGCRVQYALEYYDEDGTYYGSDKTGWAWNEGQDRTINTIHVDLSRLAGQTVQLILVVRDQGDPNGDYAVWINPRLLRQ